MKIDGCAVLNRENKIRGIDASYFIAKIALLFFIEVAVAVVKESSTGLNKAALLFGQIVCMYGLSCYFVLA